MKTYVRFAIGIGILSAAVGAAPAAVPTWPRPDIRDCERGYIQWNINHWEVWCGDNTYCVDGPPASQKCTSVVEQEGGYYWNECMCDGGDFLACCHIVLQFHSGFPPQYTPIPSGWCKNSGGTNNHPECPGDTDCELTGQWPGGEQVGAACEI